MRIAYQGEPGAYSEAAALRYAANAEVMPCRSFEEVFAAVTEGRASRGVLPMENSIGGTIHRNYDLLVEHELPIVGEVELPVDHCLLARPGTKLETLTAVYSHPQALAQCEEFLRRLTGVEVIAVYDTAGGAKMVAEGARPDAGAIASHRAAEVFGLEILSESVQDYASNLTRFAVIARSADAQQEANKTSLVFALESTPGALFRALSCFALRDINLTKLESRPIRGRPWEYMFYVDVDVARESLQYGRAVTQLAEFSQWVRTLGSYRAWSEETPG
jgi:arogenate/prephenate dehydratase